MFSGICQNGVRPRLILPTLLHSNSFLFYIAVSKSHDAINFSYFSSFCFKFCCWYLYILLSYHIQHSLSHYLSSHTSLVVDCFLFLKIPFAFFSVFILFLAFLSLVIFEHLGHFRETIASLFGHNCTNDFFVRNSYFTLILN